MRHKDRASAALLRIKHVINTRFIVPLRTQSEIYKKRDDLNLQNKKLALELLRKGKVSNLSPVTDELTLGLTTTVSPIQYPTNGIEGPPVSSLRLRKGIAWRCRQQIQNIICYIW